MRIVMVGNALDVPHMDTHKNEALTPSVDASEYRAFDRKGVLLDRLLLRADGARYVSSPLGVHHRVILKTPAFAFWEFSLGPFTSESTIPAPRAHDRGC